MLLNDNLNEVIRVIFRYFEIDFNDYSSYLYHSHPRYGHFEAMAYILSRNGIDSSLIETDGEEINSLPFPLIINYDGLFLPIIGIDKTGSFVILNESGESETIEIDKNDSGWDKRALVLQKDDKCRSDGKTERTIRTFKQMTVYFSCLIFGIAFTLLSVKVYSVHNLIRYSFLLSSILGLTVSAATGDYFWLFLYTCLFRNRANFRDFIKSYQRIVIPDSLYDTVLNKIAFWNGISG